VSSKTSLAGERTREYLERACGRKKGEFFHSAVFRKDERVDQGLGNSGSGHHVLARGAGPVGVPDFRVGRTWEKSDHPDAPRAKFFAQSAREAECSVFRGVVGSGVWKDANGGDREIVDDRPAALHQGEHGLRDQEGAGEIGIEHVLPQFVGSAVDREFRLRDAGIVDKDVEVAKMLADGFAKVVHGGGIANVTGFQQNTSAEPRRFPADFLKRGQLPAGQDEVAALSGERPSEGQSDAAAGTGNERDLSGEPRAGCGATAGTGFRQSQTPFGR